MKVRSRQIWLWAALATIAFAFSFTVVTDATAGNDGCCILPATENCTEGRGTLVWAPWPPPGVPTCTRIVDNCLVEPICW